MSRQRLVSVLVAGLCTAIQMGCGAPAGLYRRVPLPRPLAPTARVSTSEPGGLIVLHNGPSQGRHGESKALLAGDRRQLDALWLELGIEGPVPPVDLRPYLVLGASYGGGVCPGEVTAAEIDDSGNLVLRAIVKEQYCLSLFVQNARVVAVPRRFLPARVRWYPDLQELGTETAYEFWVP